MNFYHHFWDIDFICDNMHKAFITCHDVISFCCHVFFFLGSCQFLQGVSNTIASKFKLLLDQQPQFQILWSFFMYFFGALRLVWYPTLCFYVLFGCAFCYYISFPIHVGVMFILNLCGKVLVHRFNFWCWLVKFGIMVFLYMFLIFGMFWL